jgi:hypothetical protein
MVTLLSDQEDSELAFTQDQLANAFDRVRDSRDWKAPVRAEIDEPQRPVVELAIIWFTATVPTFEAVPGRAGRLTVVANGYGKGPWGQADPARRDQSLGPEDRPRASAKARRLVGCLTGGRGLGSRV